MRTWCSSSTSPGAATWPALQGRVNNYLVDGVGLFDRHTHLDMTSGAAGFGLTRPGRRAHRRIDNDTIARPARRRRDDRPRSVAMDPYGLVHVANVLLASPRLHVASGGGTYQPRRGARPPLHRGQRRLWARWRSTSPARPPAPQVALEAANPGFGIGLAQCRRHRPRGRRRLGGPGDRATPLTARSPPTSIIQSGRGPMTIDVNRLTLRRHDVRAAGSCRPRAGPFAGHADHGRPGIERHCPARRRRPLPADRRRRDRQRRAHAGRHADHRPARRSSRRRSSSTPQVLDPVATPSSPALTSGDLLRPARPGPRQSSRAAAAPPSSSPKGSAPCRSASPPTPRSRPS